MSASLSTRSVMNIATSSNKPNRTSQLINMMPWSSFQMVHTEYREHDRNEAWLMQASTAAQNF